RSRPRRHSTGSSGGLFRGAGSTSVMVTSSSETASRQGPKDRGPTSSRPHGPCIASTSWRPRARQSTMVDAFTLPSSTPRLPPMSVIWAFLLYWLVLFVACYLVTEYGQGYLYDEVTPYLWGKVTAASLGLAIVLTYAHTSLDRMFSDGLGWTIGQAILWF